LSRWQLDVEEKDREEGKEERKGDRPRMNTVKVSGLL